jgi:putative tricarboxylic transport membrane protein
MLDGFLMFSKALWGFVGQNPVMILYVLAATQLGIIVGMLPGLTATMGVALMTTLTFKMEPNSAVLILVCMYVGAI